MMILQPMGRKGRAPAHVRAWTPEEDALLIALYSSTPVKDIAVRVKRSYWGVYNRIVLLRGTYPESLKCKRPRFKPDEDKFIRKNSQNDDQQANGGGISGDIMTASAAGHE